MKWVRKTWGDYWNRDIVGHSLNCCKVILVYGTKYSRMDQVKFV